MSIIPIYVDTETQPAKFGKGWEIKEVAFYDPLTKGEFSEVVRTKSSDETHRSFIEIWFDAVKWVEKSKKSQEDTILLIGHNVKSADVMNLQKMCERFTIRYPQNWKCFDTLALSRRVNPFKHHRLQYIRHKFGVPAWKQHRAGPDAKGLHYVFKRMIGTVPEKEIFQLAKDEEKGMDLIAEKVLANRKVVPIFYDFVMSGRLKHDKFEEGNYPHVIKIDAYCPYRNDNQRYTQDVNPDESQTSDQPTFRHAFPEFKKWTKDCLEGDVAGRVCFIAYNNFNHMNKMFDLECERSGRIPSKRWGHFDLSYLKSCLYKGFYEQKWQGNRDLSFFELLDHLQIPQTGDTLEDTYHLFEGMMGPVDRQSVYTTMIQQRSIKKVAEKIKANWVARPIFFDLETTGLPPKKGEDGEWPRIVEISAYAPHKPVGKDRFETLVDGECQIPSEASKINKIKNKHLVGKPNWLTVGPEFMKWATHGLKPWEKLVLIAHKCYHFDYPVLEKEFERVGLSMRKDTYAFCTWFLSNCLLGGRGNRLCNLAEKFKIVQANAHRAGDDVDVMYKVFLNLIGRADIQTVYNTMLTKKNPVKAVAAVIKEAQPVYKRTRDENEIEKPASKKAKRVTKGAKRKLPQALGPVTRSKSKKV